MEIFERNGKWVWREKPGVQKTFDTREEAHKAAGIPMEDLPLPEVQEFDSMEDALSFHGEEECLTDDEDEAYM